MESHSTEARRCGFDAIWWSDHARIFDSYDEDITIRFRRAELIDDGRTILFSKGRARTLTRLAVERAGNACSVSIDRARIRIDFSRLREPCSPRSVRLVLGSDRGKVHTLDFCRPVASGLKVSVWGDFSDLRKRHACLRFGFDLSWHPKGQHHLVLDFVSGGAGPIEVSGDTLVTGRFPIEGSENQIVIDIESLASNLPNGYDNTLSNAWLEVATDACEPLGVLLDSLKIHSDRPGGENQYRVVEELAKRYESAFAVTEYVGVELGLFHTPLLPHMNAYLPDSTRGFDGMDAWRVMPRDEWVDLIHAKGGLVSFNHPFGASLRPRHIPEDSLPPQAPPRRIWRSGTRVKEDDFWRVANPILERNGLNADILEVGYLFRGSGSLEDHLRLWDLALANGINLVGDGVSDSHGGRWEPNMLPGDFATWIWARSKDADELLKALKHGRVAFGDPFFWNGKFAFGIEDALMGDTLHVEEGGTAQAWILIDPPRDDIIVRLLQVEIRKGRDLSIVRDDTLQAECRKVSVKTTAPTYVRIEVYARDGTPLIFSNPVFLLHP